VRESLFFKSGFLFKNENLKGLNLPHRMNVFRSTICKLTKLSHLVFLLSLLFSHTVQGQQNQLVDYVDPNIGSAHSRWFFYTPAALPFGMAKLGPSTNSHYGNKSGWEAVGYDERHESIEGFVHFHEFQIGGILFMSTTGELKTVPGKLEAPDDGYRSRFSHKNEIAKPGYYSVFLQDYNITAELTATKRVGVHRYTFPKSAQSHIIFDIGNEQGESGDVEDAFVAYGEKGEIYGWVSTKPKYVGSYKGGAPVKMFFSAIVNKTPDEWGCFKKDEIFGSKKEMSGVGAGLYFTFLDTQKDDSVELVVGLSYNSIENARQNREKEARGLSFKEAKNNALSIWENELGKIKVEGATEDKVKFYTSLFHALLGRGVANDVDGSYPKADGSVGKIPLDKNGKATFNFYNSDAVWGAFWNLTQLWALAWPEYYNDFVQTHLTIYKDRSWFGDGIANSRYVSGVGTNYVSLVTAAAYQCGIRNFDVNLAYEACKKDILEWQNRPPGAGKGDLKNFIQSGYSFYPDKNKSQPGASGFSASHTLEYSFGAFAVAQFAKALGKTADYNLLIDYADNWKLLYNSENNFIVPRLADGSFKPGFKPEEAWRGFQEGNSWQYTYYVPHDVNGLREKMGIELFNSRLDTIFNRSRRLGFGGGKKIDAFAGLENYYNHGNQPSLHMSYLFNFSGKPWLTQKWTRLILDEFYGTDGIHGYGYGQDEDQGQLGAWYVIASLGLFDVKGLTDMNPEIQIGSPKFEQAVIKLGNGKTLTLNASNNKRENYYIQSLRVNGQNWSKFQLDRDVIIKGGTLDFEMGSVPNEQWGVE
jgi:predicted alpha-1,2-mannosidase